MTIQVTQVRYTVKKEYVPFNQERIARVMADLRAMQVYGLRYSVYLESDGKTFNHTVFADQEAAENVLLSLRSFKRFQEELNNGHLEVEPHVVHGSVVNSSWDIV